MSLSSAAGLSIERLQTGIAGSSIGPNDDGYDAARALAYGGMDRRPAVIVRVANAEDVARVVQLARETGLDLAVKCGGHSLAGHSVNEGGIVCDVSPLKSIELDPAAGVVRLGAGLSAGDVTATLAEHGVAVPFGDTGSVGIAGLTLGGGVGYLVRKHGMTIDSLLGAEIVTAAGEILEVDAASHPDLFWAIRGGGGNFGIATRFTFRLHPVDRIYGGMLVLPATANVVAGFVAASIAAPDELSGIVSVMSAPPLPFIPPDLVGQRIVAALMAYAGDPESGPAAFASFRALATPLVDMLRPMRYIELYPPEQAGFHPMVVSRDLLTDRLGSGEAEAIVAAVRVPGPPRLVQLRVLGGAMARVPADATAFAHRQRPIMVNAVSFHDGSPDAEAAGRRWVDGIADRLRQGEDASYVNFVQDAGEESVRACYPPETLGRLVGVKRTYDPENLFHMNHNIRPDR